MSFHYEMAAWFNEQSWIERYSPFGAMKNVSGFVEGEGVEAGSSSGLFCLHPLRCKVSRRPTVLWTLVVVSPLSDLG
jgi:hypothetical protein